MNGGAGHTSDGYLTTAAGLKIRYVPDGGAALHEFLAGRVDLTSAAQLPSSDLTSVRPAGRSRRPHAAEAAVLVVVLRSSIPDVPLGLSLEFVFLSGRRDVLRDNAEPLGDICMGDVDASYVRSDSTACLQYTATAMFPVQTGAWRNWWTFLSCQRKHTANKISEFDKNSLVVIPVGAE